VPSLADAQHEAAHIVVGVALGLRLRKASVQPWPDGDADGWVWFPLPPKRRTWAQAVMVAAGVAWERAVRPSVCDAEGDAQYDWADLLAQVPTRHDAETCVRAAASLLTNLGPVHARVTRALLERDLTGADVARLARGERLSADE
jgi:hypothetical protein